jgi:hypothetical protein
VARVAVEQEAIAQRLNELLPKLKDCIEGGKPEVKQVMARAEVGAVFRPLTIAVAQLGPDGRVTVKDVLDRPSREYWRIVPTADGPVFHIVATRSGSEGIHWNSTPAVPGEILIAPADDISTRELLDRYLGTHSGGALPAGWPANLDDLSVVKGRNP